MQTKYTYKEIWLIAYPILISLLMEQMIGMTDTAFLAHVVTSPYKLCQMSLRMQAFDVHIVIICMALNSYKIITIS